MAVSVESYLRHHAPTIGRIPGAVTLLKKLFHENEINRFLSEHARDDAFGFVEAVVEHMQLDIMLNRKELDRIPACGRAVIIANHPLGALDAMALIDLIKDVRKDIKILANDFLYAFENLRELVIPVDNVGGKLSKRSFQAIYEALENEELLILFPAGEVSRAGVRGISDGRWMPGFYKIASRMRTPIVPVFIDAKNSSLFYTLSFVNKKIATVLLPHEMMRYESRAIGFKIGRQIPYDSYAMPSLPAKESVKLLRKHFYRVARGKKPLLQTVNEIALPEAKTELKEVLYHAEELGETFDGKKILLYRSDKKDVVFKEIGRLREISFRSVGEGSGKKRDIDDYDYMYRHLIIWDDAALEIAGAYRIGICNEIVPVWGIEGLYTSTLFDYDDAFMGVMQQGIELGRSFVQPRYRNSRALDYLWQGIGAYVRMHPEFRYLFGPVSLSAAYDEASRALLVLFYRRFFGARGNTPVRHKIPYRPAAAYQEAFERDYADLDYLSAMRTLKKTLSDRGYAVPTLYKQYTEVTEPGGSEFLDFGIDPDFADCIDGFIVVDLDKLKPAKRKRYLGA